MCHRSAGGESGAIEIVFVVQEGKNAVNGEQTLWDEIGLLDVFN